VNSFKRRRVLYTLLLFLFVFSIFYPSLYDELLLVDDYSLIDSLKSLGSVSLKDLFLPSGSILYYRPFLMSTYILEKHIHGLHLPFMHLFNILLHYLNTLLVFSISLRVLKREEVSKAFLIALLFGLHPLATESVNWISGRTDLLAGTFVLLSSLMVLRFRDSGKLKDLFMSFIFLFLGMLTKEVALGFVFALPLMVFSKTGSEENPSNRDNLKRLLVLLLYIIGSVSLYLIIRNLPFEPDKRIRLTIEILTRGDSIVFYNFMSAIGFYIKKIFMPYPLNFAIDGVDPLYGLLLGIPVTLFSLYLIYKRTILSVFFVTGIFLIIPSLPVSLGRIAWTPYAERYVYLPMAFIIPSVFIYLDKRLSFLSLNLKKIVVVFILLLMASYTFYRNIIWMKNFTLFEDTIRQSPDFKPIQMEYAGQLIERGRYDEALFYLKKAKKAFSLFYDEAPDLAICEVYILKGELKNALEVTEEILKKKKDSTKALEFRLKILTLMYNKKEKGIIEELRKTYEEYKRLRGDGFVHYNMAKFFISNGMKRDALSALKQAIEILPEGSPYRGFSERLLKRLQYEERFN
jgi:hypothetical protein